VNLQVHTQRLVDDRQRRRTWRRVFGQTACAKDPAFVGDERSVLVYAVSPDIEIRAAE